ncbi:glutamine--fructose-6-phosphate aminotransferase, partial [Burkholderia multivorans]
THGGPTDVNAHPHVADGGRLALIHNGIIENFAQLKAPLVADGFEFTSETDTEVAAAQLAKNYRECGDLTDAMRVTAQQLEGAFTLLAVHADLP